MALKRRARLEPNMVLVGYYTRTLVTAGRQTGGAGAAGSAMAVPAENFDRYQRGQKEPVSGLTEMCVQVPRHAV